MYPNDWKGGNRMITFSKENFLSVIKRSKENIKAAEDLFALAENKEDLQASRRLAKEFLLEAERDLRGVMAMIIHEEKE